MGGHRSQRRNFLGTVGSPIGGFLALAVGIGCPSSARAAGFTDDVTFVSGTKPIQGNASPANPGLFLNQSWNNSGSVNGIQSFDLDFSPIIDETFYFGA